ncbi:MAG: glycosyltransferase [Bacteroidetes bacterium]|nr:glycosyltransferase [Bacteroidota bacterium]
MKNLHFSKISILAGRLLGRGGTETVLLHIFNDKNLKKIFTYKLFVTERSEEKGLLPFLAETGLKKAKITLNQSSGCIRNFKRFIYLVFTNSDFIIGLTPKEIKKAAQVRKILKKKYKIVSWIHFSIKYMPGHSYERMKKELPLADYHLSISDGLTKELNEIGLKDNVFTIYNPVRRQEQTILQPNENKTKLVYVGRLENQQKNILELFDILDLIADDFNLDIYGSGPDEEMLQKEVAKNKKLNEKIVWKGWKSNPWNEIKQADALVLTSNYEGFPMTLNEAISRGLPAISYDLPVGPSSLIQDGVNGYLVEFGNKREFAEKIMTLSNRKLFNDRQSVKNSLEFLYDNQYSKRVIDAFSKMNGLEMNRIINE